VEKRIKKISREQTKGLKLTTKIKESKKVYKRKKKVEE
jgi:hypothetical protein